MKITPEIEAIKAAIKAKRAELIHLPLERIYDELAIAAIRALRVPSKRQIELWNAEYYNGTGSMHYIYTAMIDAALGENE